MRAVLGLSTAILLGLAGCQKAETPEQAQARMDRESAAARTQFEAVARSWEGWTAAAQADSIAGAFAEQGREFPPNAALVVGRDAIKAYQVQLFGMGRWTIRLTVDEATANGPVAVSRGTYVVAVKPGPNAPAGMAAIADTGKYVSGWRQTGGKWEFTDLIWNSNLPLPAPAPARRK